MLVNGTSSPTAFVSGALGILGDMTGIAAAIFTWKSLQRLIYYLFFCMRVSSLQGFGHIYCSGLLLGFCFLFMRNVVCTICDF